MILQCKREVVYSPYGIKYPSESQEAFHDLGSKFKGFSGPVGSGKSAALCHEALKLAYENPGLPGILGAPTYTMLRDITRAAFLEICAANDVPHEFRAADNEVRLLEPRSTVRFRSLDNPLRLVGSNLAWFGLDELTYSKEDAWLRMLARLRHPKAKHLCGFAVWTPKGFDWVYNRFVGPDKIAGYEAIFARPGENTALPADFYEGLKASYDERFYRQEVLGEYLPQFTGQVYYAFNRANNLRSLTFDPHWPLCWALDFNIDPMCSVLAQVVDVTTREQMLRGETRREIRILDEIILPDTRTMDATAVFLKRIQPMRDAGLRSLAIYGDASGSAGHTSSKKSDWQIVKEILKRETDLAVTFRVPEANPPVRERVNAVNGMLRNAAGESRLFVDPRCKELIKDCEQVSWKRDNAGNALDEMAKSDPKRTHVSDAAGYLVHKETKPRGGPRATVII